MAVYVINTVGASGATVCVMRVCVCVCVCVCVEPLTETT
jgi:hypothetical protein